MDGNLFSDRSLVKRLGAERYLLISLVSFAASVIVTRLFLELTGYPQLGNTTLHIAHVLWGGLLLFIGGLLPLILANAWIYTVSAILNGMGVGLFIDEVGKFITQNNDYFYPPAAPIIYAFFLLIALLYLYLRRPVQQTPRQLLYQVIHDLGEVLDHDLQPDEKAHMQRQLQEVIARAPDSNLELLARELMEFLDSESLRLFIRPPTRLEQTRRFLESLRKIISQRWLTQPRFRLLLASLLAISGGARLLRLLWLYRQAHLDRALTDLFLRTIESGLIQTPRALQWAIIRLALEGGFSLLMVGAAFLLARRSEFAGTRLATISLVMSLTTVNLLVFYFDQFGAVVTTLWQFSLLMFVSLYRSWFMQNGAWQT
ncbi:MAG: hypothetical protein QME21_07405 [Anaerolineales bacterium]|nr:hypothetical protein [Anaerolineales bacterium]